MPDILTNLRLSDDNRIVHGLWIGPALSSLEKLTIRSFQAQGHEFHLWIYDEVSEVPSGTVLEDANDVVERRRVFRYRENDPHRGLGKGSLAGFSDIFRYRLLFEKGGWWADMDVTCLRPLDFESPYVFREHETLPVVGNIMKCPPRSALMASCFEHASREVDEHNRDWVKPVRILCDEIERLGLTRFIVPGLANPEVWEEIEARVLSNAPLRDGIHVFHWCNEKWRTEGIQRDPALAGTTYSTLLELFGVVRSGW